MTYEETLEKIHEFNRFGSRLGLERMNTLMEYLGNPQDSLQVIHVAGTNGKGSVSRYIYCALRACGYQAGLFTSPYLEHFTERIEWEGQEISREDLVFCTEQVLKQAERMIGQGMDSPTEFEIVTAIAFVYFKHKKTDFVILEVGLGGRGDSTNILKKPLVTAITSISFDHMQFLGDTLAAIASEKAGIIKEGCPMVCCVKDAEAFKVIQKTAEAHHAPLIPVALDSIKITEASIAQYCFEGDALGRHYSSVAISMAGRHQTENALCALTILEVLRKKCGTELPKAKVLEGIRGAVQTGRMEVLEKNPYLIVDGAHNRAGVEALGRTIEEHFKGKKLLLITGILADKEVDEMIGWFGKLTADFAATEPDNPRKLSSKELCQAFEGRGFACVDVGDASRAFDFARRQKEKYDVIIFAGSLYLIGKIRELWNNGRY